MKVVFYSSYFQVRVQLGVDKLRDEDGGDGHDLLLRGDVRGHVLGPRVAPLPQLQLPQLELRRGRVRHDHQRGGSLLHVDGGRGGQGEEGAQPEPADDDVPLGRLRYGHHVLLPRVSVHLK